MDMKMCAASDVAKEWDKIDWNKAKVQFTRDYTG